MKTFAFVLLSVILSATATPLGDRAVFRRHNGIALSRRYILQSRQDAPAACAALPSNTTAVPDPTATDLPTVDPSTADNSTDTTDPSLTSSNTTVADPTATDNSTATANSTVTRRFWARHGFHGGFSDTTFEHTSVSVSFEETITSFVSQWDDLCLNSGGDIFTHDPCVNLGGSFAIDALLETADPCDQQDIADSIITFAKSDGIRNRDALINYGISFRRHARRSVEILGVVPSSLFCLRAPINPELVGVYNEQCDGVNPGVFGSPNTPLVPFGAAGTCPLGMSPDVDTCGCVSSDGTDDSTDTSDSTDSTDDSSDSTDSTDDSSDATDSTGDSSDSTDSTDASSTDSSDASSTDSADASTATDATSTDTADATAATSDATVTPPPDPTGPNFQPTDISGNVNDPAGRRK